MKTYKLPLLLTLLAVAISGYCFGEATEREDFQSLCKLYQETSGTAGALAQAESFVSKYSDSEYLPRAQYIMASCYGDSLDAIRLYGKIASKNKDSEIAISSVLMIAQIYYNLGKYKEAEEYYQKVITEHPSHFSVREALYQLMQNEIALGQWDKAEATLRKLLLTDPYYEKQDKVIYSYGLALYHQGNYEAALQKFNALTTTEALYYQGRCQEKLQKYIPATVTFKQLLTQYPKSIFEEDVRFLISDCFYRSGDYPLAMTEYNKFLEDFPGSYLKENTLYRIGCCYYLEKQYNDAIEKFRGFMQDYTTSEFTPYSSFMVGESFLAQKDLIRSSFAYGEILKNFPQNEIIPETYYKLGWCYSQQNSFESAIDIYNRLITAFPKHTLVPYALLLSADNYTRMGQIDQAVECYRKVLDMPKKTDEITEVALFMMTKTFYDAKRYGDILSSFQYILNSLPPSNSEWRSYTYLMVAESYYAMSFFTESTRVYDMVIKNFPYTQVASMAQEGKAWAAFKVKDYSKAEKDRQEFTEDMTVKKGKSTQISNEFEMGNIYFNQKKYVEALDVFEKFEQTYPEDELVPESIFNSGRCYYKLEYYSKAIQSWERVINKYPKYGKVQESMNLVADTYFRAQKYPESIESYKRIIAAYPETEISKQSQLRIAQCYYNAGDNETSIIEFQRFLNTYPNDLTAQAALDGIAMSADRMIQAGASTDLDIKVLQDFVVKYPKSKIAGDAQFRIAMRYYEKKNYPRAAKEFVHVADFSASEQNVPDSYFYGAEGFYYAVDYVDAIPIYRRFIKNFPKHAQLRIAYLHLANSLYYTEKFYDAALVYQDLTKLTKDKDEVAQTALINSALCLKKSSKFQDAATAYESYLEQYPKSENSGSTLVELFSLYEMLKQYDNAIAVAQELLEKLPQNNELRPELMYKIGELDLKQGNLKQGIPELKALLKYMPLNDPWRLSAIARVAQEYENHKQWDDAIAMYKEVMNSTSEKKWINAAQERIQACNLLKQQETETAK